MRATRFPLRAVTFREIIIVVVIVIVIVLVIIIVIIIMIIIIIQRQCLTTRARESLRETLRSSERFYFALARIEASTNSLRNRFTFSRRPTLSSTNSLASLVDQLSPTRIEASTNSERFYFALARIEIAGSFFEGPSSAATGGCAACEPEWLPTRR